MPHFAAILLAGLLLVPAAARAADSPPAGNWKVTLIEQGERKTFWLVQFENKDGKWAGTLLDTKEGVAKSNLEDVRAAGDTLHFTIQAGGARLRFEVRVPKEAAKTLLGSVLQDRVMAPAQLEATTIKGLDDFETSKDILTNHPNDPRIFSAAMTLLGEAEQKKAKPEEVRGWADKAFRLAESYGPRWHRETAVRIAATLLDQEPFAAVGLEYARRAERLLDAKDEALVQERVLNLLQMALKKTGKADEAKELQARIDKLAAQADQEWLKQMPPFKPVPFAGRKDKNDRVVLVELFTGAQCPPCVAADLAFDGLLKSYKPAEVALLQYHVHANGPDPLTNAETEARSTYYEQAIEGYPTAFFNGRTPGSEGGPASEAGERYGQYRSIIDQFLERPPRAKLKAAAVRKGDQIDITAEVADAEKVGESVRLRLVLAEREVRYLGGNQVRFHHHVVRAMPGGPEGFALKEKTAKQTARIDLGEVRKGLTKYLDEFAKSNPFPNANRPMELKELILVAFVQDDLKKEVMQAVQVDVTNGNP